MSSKARTCPGRPTCPIACSESASTSPPIRAWSAPSVNGSNGATQPTSRDRQRRVRARLLSLLLVLGCASNVNAAAKSTRDVSFASVEGVPLLLDVYLPEGGKKPLGL